MDCRFLFARCCHDLGKLQEGELALTGALFPGSTTQLKELNDTNGAVSSRSHSDEHMYLISFTLAIANFLALFFFFFISLVVTIIIIIVVIFIMVTIIILVVIVLCFSNTIS